MIVRIGDGELFGRDRTEHSDDHQRHYKRAMSLHLGLDVGGTNLKWAVVERESLEPRLVKTGLLPTDTREGERSVVRQLIEVARTVSGDIEGIESVGVACPVSSTPPQASPDSYPTFPGIGTACRSPTRSRVRSRFRA